MAKFPYPLNTSSADVQTNSVYDTDVAQWMQKVQNYVQTPGGVWVPQKCDSEGSALVQLSGSNEVQVNSSALPTGASTEATLALIKAKTDNIPSDPSKESGKLTALETLITTLNEKIDTLDAVIDSIKDTDGIKKITDTVDVQLSGSKMELYGASLDDRPDATTVPIGATFTIVDASQEFRSWMSNGTNWGEEI